MPKRKSARRRITPPVIPPEVTALAGMDGGVSGSFSGRLADGSWFVHPAVISRFDGYRVLDVHANLRYLASFAEKAGGVHRVYIACEHSRPNPKFGGWNNRASVSPHY